MVESRAESAYAAALDEIERVKREGGTELRLGGRPFRSLERIPSEVAGIVRLQTLVLTRTAVTDLAPIGRLTSLRWLELDQTKISDLNPISDLTEIRWLWLNETAVTNLAPVEGLIQLTLLSLRQTGVADLSALSGLVNLESLFLNQTSVADLTPIAHLHKLKKLRLGQTPVSNLTPLRGLTAIEELNLDQTSIADLSPLSGLTAMRELNLDQTAIFDLSPISGLAALETLSVYQTSVSDLTPLASLTELSRLTLQGSRVTDLRPLCRLELMGIDGPPGLSFANTPAAERDPDLARLALISDERDRAQQTLTYLNSLPPWPAPYTPRAHPDGLPPEQDAALPLIWGEKGFSFLAAQVGGDPVTAAVLEDLLPLIEDLRRKGNRHDDLYRLAGELQERATGEISALNMVKLHLSYQKLRRVYVGREARAERFDDETVTAIAGVLEIVPGVTLADAGVQVLIERQEQERARKVTPEVAAAEAQVLASVQAEDAPFDPAVQDAARVILLPGMDDRLAASRGILSRNAVIVVLKYVGGAAAAGAVGGPVGNYVYDHGPQLLALAQTMGDDAYFWAQMILAKFKGQYELAMGIAREVTQAGPVRLRPGKRDIP